MKATLQTRMAEISASVDVGPSGGSRIRRPRIKVPISTSGNFHLAALLHNFRMAHSLHFEMFCKFNSSPNKIQRLCHFCAAVQWLSYQSLKKFYGL